MTQYNNIEYIGYNISPEGTIIEEKIYYFWDRKLTNLIPEQIMDVFSPFDYGKRKDDEISISGFIDDSKSENISTIFEFINGWMTVPSSDFVLRQFFSIYNLSERWHYSPILSLKYKSVILSKISLYIGPLQNKSAMPKYLERTLDTFKMSHDIAIRNMIKRLVTSKVCDMYLAAWDIDEAGCCAYKIYLKIKDFKETSAILKKELDSLTPYLQKVGFRLSDIGFVFVKDTLIHYNLYYKPLY